MNIVFTTCSNNYLAQALTLRNSITLKEEDLFIIGLVDTKQSAIKYEEYVNILFLPMTEIGLEGIWSMIDRYNVVEINTAVKPFYFQYFFNKYKDLKTITYFDPDIYLYSDFYEVIEELSDYDILLTPHITSPVPAGSLPFDNEFLTYGVFNLGFLCVKNTNNAKEMLKWWGDRTFDLCISNTAEGIYVDQLWHDLTPIFFDKVKISKHLGMNMGFWNLFERKLYLQNEKYTVNEKFKLLFFHYSSFDFNDLKTSKSRNTYSLEDNIELKSLFENYKKVVLGNDYLFFKSFKYGYNHLRLNYVEKQKTIFINTSTKLKILNSILVIFPQKLIQKVSNLCYDILKIKNYNV